MYQFPNREKPYKKLAKYYDFIYSTKDYKKEADQLRRLIRKYKKSPGKRLLEVACGTGGHLQYLKKDFTITATDLNLEMLEVARRKNKSGVTFKQADMVKLNLGKKFDIILCLFSSIGYVKTYSNLGKVLNNFSDHLKQGGVVIIEPWLTRAIHKIGLPNLTTYDGNNFKIARVGISKRQGNISILDMHHLIAEKGKSVEYVVERNELGLFEVNRTLKLMQEAGLRGQFLKRGLIGRGLYIGIKK